MRGQQRVALETIAFSMNATQIQNMRRAFVKMDKDRSGFVTTAEFVSILTQEGLTETEAKEIFRHADRDQKNKLSYSEFLAATLDRRFYLQIDRIREAFQR